MINIQGNKVVRDKKLFNPDPTWISLRKIELLDVRSELSKQRLECTLKLIWEKKCSNEDTKNKIIKYKNEIEEINNKIKMLKRYMDLRGLVRQLVVRITKEDRMIAEKQAREIGKQQEKDVKVNESERYQKREIDKRFCGYIKTSGKGRKNNKNDPEWKVQWKIKPGEGLYRTKPNRVRRIKMCYCCMFLNKMQ